jgi:hypothetical protein
MRLSPSFLFSALLLFAVPAAHSQGDLDAELKQLIQKRNAALAAAIGPIDARFKTDAEQLLRRATQVNDASAVKKIKETLGIEGGPSPATAPAEAIKDLHRIESVKDLHKQLTGTTWKAVPQNQTRPGLGASITFNEGTLQPGDLHYDINSHNSLTIVFKGGDKQPATLSPDGKHLKLPFRKGEFIYELANP